MKSKDILKILERNDRHELADNKMTYYGLGLGGGSIHYWDGNWDCDDSGLPHSMLGVFENSDAKVEVYCSGGNFHLAQRYYHSWRPDRIVSHYLSHKRVIIKERKTIYNDVFLNELFFSNYNENSRRNMRIVVSGRYEGSAQVQRRDNYIYIVQKNGGRRKDIHKVIGVSRDFNLRVDKDSYQLEVPLLLEPNKGEHLEEVPLYIAVAMGETQEKTMKRYEETIADPISIFEKKKEEWESFYEQFVPQFSCNDPLITKLYYHAWYVCKTNMFDFNNEGYYRHPFTCPGKFRLLPQWFWDSAFHSIYEKWLNKGFPVPYGSIRNILEAKAEDGHLPFTLAKKKFVTGKLIQPFILPIAIWDIYQANADKEFLAQALTPLIDFDRWMEENRDTNREGLVHIILPGESGWDNSKRFILQPPFFQRNSPLVKEKRWIQPADFNTYLYLGRMLISKMAEELNRTDIADQYKLKAKKTLEGIQDMWDEKIGLFCDRFEDNHEGIMVKSLGGMIPSLAGIPDKNQMEKIVAHLLNPEEFWSKYPVPTLSMDDPDFNVRDEYQSYWNGRVWPNINWQIIEGLCRYGYLDIAKELALRTLKMAVASGEPYCTENYHPQEAYCYDLNENIFNYGWAGLVNDILIRRIMGIQPNIPKGRLYLDPLFPEEWNNAQINGLELGLHRIDLKIQRRREHLFCELTHKGDSSLTVVTSDAEVTIKNKTITLSIGKGGTAHWLTF